jgi:putative transposase
MKPARGYEAMRGHRVSIPGAAYFVTLCTRGRVAGLDKGFVAKAIRTELTAMDSELAFALRSWTIMPEHLHLFFNVTDRLTLGQIVGRLKAKTRSVLLGAGLAWQGNYYEHRLRPDDAVEDVLRYIYLNPYHAKLIQPSEAHAYFWLSETDAQWFVPSLNDNHPFPEWLKIT